MPLILALEKQRQEDLCQFKASLVYRTSSKIAKAMQRNPVLKSQNPKQWQQQKATSGIPSALPALSGPENTLLPFLWVGWLATVKWTPLLILSSAEEILVFCLFVCFVLFFRDRVSLCRPGCPGTHFVDQASLELRNPPASASQVLGLKACATTARGLIL